MMVCEGVKVSAIGLDYFWKRTFGWNKVKHPGNITCLSLSLTTRQKTPKPTAILIVVRRFSWTKILCMPTGFRKVHLERNTVLYLFCAVLAAFLSSLPLGQPLQLWESETSPLCIFRRSSPRNVAYRRLSQNDRRPIWSPIRNLHDNLQFKSERAAYCTPTCSRACFIAFGGNCVWLEHCRWT